MADQNGSSEDETATVYDNRRGYPWRTIKMALLGQINESIVYIGKG
jgi:hypothetical protein